LLRPVELPLAELPQAELPQAELPQAELPAWRRAARVRRFAPQA